jgi:hypothetical protein
MIPLTKGQIESFALIALGQISCQWGAYLAKTEDGLVSNEQEERFYRINSMWNAIWLYDPSAENNCLTDEEVYYICMKIQEELCFSVVLNDLPETNLN